jgi:hypothetical protein
MVGEIVAFLALGMLERTGLFELKPPPLLKKKGEFPDCVEILSKRNADRANPPVCGKFVKLCRITGLAWSLWVWGAIFASVVLGYLFIHLFTTSSPEKMFDEMRNVEHTPFTLSLAQGGPVHITCWVLFCLFTLAFLLTFVQYSVLLTFCQDAASTTYPKPPRARAASASG